MKSLAEQQLETARRDPRLDHGREAIVSDWWGAVAAAERTRRVAIDGMMTLAETAVEQPRNRENREAVAAWERAKFARHEMAADNPELNAMTLVALLSALDALVESFVPAGWEFVMSMQFDRGARSFAAEHPDLDAKLTDEQRDGLKAAFMKATLGDLSRKVRQPQPGGEGARRWEEALRPIGLGVSPERPIPPDLDAALCEVVMLRHALVHRAGRLRESDFIKARELRRRYADGDLIRITRLDFKTYSAAIVAYGSDVVRRIMGSLVEPLDLAKWQEEAALNT